MLNEKSQFDGCDIRFLYEYNEFFRSLLFQYKGQYDIALAPVFLSYFLRELRHRYANYIVACCPSGKDQNECRGFAPMEEIAKTLTLPLFTGLIKMGEYKQADQPFKKRKEIYDHIAIVDGKDLYQKEILLIDDVMTSGHTLKACLNQLRKRSPKKIDILILSCRKHRKTLSSENSF
ncbi:ComF family protein [Beduini massiliensis]|uniref:ComF family protein n=1 Tax=Beduini massiliensis TaxID=1585974 RepID=UPI0011CBA90B|nr:phosphoribosyltransferase [Beduini massiliensis]